MKKREVLWDMSLAEKSQAVYLKTHKPISVFGNLSVNFSTSAPGYLRIELLDENEDPLDGYDSGRLFGDSTSRPVDFERSLDDLAGQKIRMKITMKDADFYSFCFEG